MPKEIKAKFLPISNIKSFSPFLLLIALVIAHTEYMQNISKTILVMNSYYFQTCHNFQSILTKISGKFSHSICITVMHMHT